MKTEDFSLEIEQNIKSVLGEDIEGGDGPHFEKVGWTVRVSVEVTHDTLSSAQAMAKAFSDLVSEKPASLRKRYFSDGCWVYVDEDGKPVKFGQEPGDSTGGA